MTLPRPTLFTLAAIGGAFLLTLGVLGVLHRGAASPATGSRAAVLVPPLPGASTDELIRFHQQRVRARPDDVAASAALARAYLQKVRETGDASFYARAGAVLASARKVAADNEEILVAEGTLALTRHDFRAGLHYGLLAHRAYPAVNAAYPVIIDGQMELGEYSAAERTLQEFIDRKPSLAGYARVSYFRELHGDLAGALAAMSFAASGGIAGENLAYVQTLLGNLHFDRGQLGAARAAYRQAGASFPGYVPAEAGLARVEAARSELPAAIRRYRAIVTRLPLPEHVIALGEAELAAGRRDVARRDLDLVRAEERLLQANGVNTDVELALYEANHGSSTRAVRLARRAVEQAPSVRSADALGWALTRTGHPGPGLSWARRALRLGSRDPMFLYHAGMSARTLGARAAARAYLHRALSPNPRFSPLYAPRAKHALEGLR